MKNTTEIQECYGPYSIIDRFLQMMVNKFNSKYSAYFVAPELIDIKKSFNDFHLVIPELSTTKFKLKPNNESTIFNISNISLTNTELLNSTIKKIKDVLIDSFNDIRNFPEIHIPYDQVIIFSNTLPVFINISELEPGKFGLRIFTKMIVTPIKNTFNGFPDIEKEENDIIDEYIIEIVYIEIDLINIIKNTFKFLTGYIKFKKSDDVIQSIMSEVLNELRDSMKYDKFVKDYYNVLKQMINIYKSDTVNGVSRDFFVEGNFCLKLIKNTNDFINKMTLISIIELINFIKFTSCKNISEQNTGNIVNDTINVRRKVKGKIKNIVKDRCIEEKILVINNKHKNVQNNANTTDYDTNVTHSDRKLHTVRGHFRHYTPERPMGRGKVVGTFWVPAFVRGNKKNGEIIKSYQIKNVGAN